MCIILFLLSNVSTSYSHPTAAILKHHRLLSTPQSTKTKKIRKYISHLELRTCCSNTHRPYSPAVATSRLHPAPLRVQVWRRARRGCKRVFLLFFLIADIPHLPSQPPSSLKKTQLIYFILTPSSASRCGVPLSNTEKKRAARGMETK